MAFPVPRRGLVIRYAFLWSDEAARGAAEAAKDRPCAIVVATEGESGATRVAVVPITHARPDAGSPAHLPLTATDLRALGLDGAPHWVVVDEVNRFTWPGHDLRPIPGTGRIDHGMLPEASFRRVIALMLDLDRDRRLARRPPSRAIERDE